MLEIFQILLKRLKLKKTNNFPIEPDALEVQRQEDLKTIEPYLVQHELYGAYFSKNWDSLKKYIRLENYHKDIFFVKHDEITRKVFILVSGSVLAYVIDNNVPNQISVHRFKQNDLISELAALFNSPWHYGLQTLEDCVLVSIDLESIENQETNLELYKDLIDLLHHETGKVCAEIYNYMLKNKIDLIDLLGKHNLFADIKQLSVENLHKLADSCKYVFLASNTIILENYNKSSLCIIESGTVEQVKTYDSEDLSLVYIDNNSLTVDKNTDNKNSKPRIYNFARKLISNQKYLDLNKSNLNKNQPSHNIIIKQDVYRYGTIGEENLNKFSNINLNATTKTPCCLLEVNIENLVQKDSIIAQVFGFFNNKINRLEQIIINKK